MSKAILIMDMPDNCITCKLSDWATCRFTKKCNTKGKQPDCPLRELPEKMPKSEADKYYYAKGYNDCIDEILKGEDHEV